MRNQYSKRVNLWCPVCDIVHRKHFHKHKCPNCKQKGECGKPMSRHKIKLLLKATERE